MTKLLEYIKNLYAAKKIVVDKPSEPVIKDVPQTVIKNPPIVASTEALKKIYHLDEAGRKELILSEGFKRSPYRDTKGIPTIGIGSTEYPDGRRVSMSDKPLTDEGVMELFNLTIGKYEKAVSNGVKVPINQHQFNALTSFTYNVGVHGFSKSSLLKRVNAAPNNVPEITAAFLMWLKPPEIAGRRKKEVAYYFKK